MQLKSEFESAVSAAGSVKKVEILSGDIPIITIARDNLDTIVENVNASSPHEREWRFREGVAEILNSQAINNLSNGGPSVHDETTEKPHIANGQFKSFDGFRITDANNTVTTIRTGAVANNLTGNTVTATPPTPGFVGNYIGNYSRDFVGEYTGNFSRDFAGEYTGNYSRSFSGQYTGTFSSYFTGNYTGNYSRTFTGNYTGTYSRQFAGNYSRVRVSAYSRLRTSAYTGTYSRDRVSTYVGDFIGDYARNFAGNYTRSFEGNYARSFVGNYVGATVSDSLTNVTETYTLYVRVA